MAFIIEVNQTKQTSSGSLFPRKGRDRGGSVAAPERLTPEPPLPEPALGMLGVASASRESRTGGCGIGGNRTVPHRTGRAGSGPPVSSCGVQRAGSAPSCAPARAVPQPELCPSPPARHPSAPAPSKWFGWDPGCSGARFYFTSFKCKKGDNFPEPVNSLELVLSAPGLGLWQQARSLKQG